MRLYTLAMTDYARKLRFIELATSGCACGLRFAELMFYEMS